MPAQAAPIELREREAPLRRIAVPEGLLVARLNACLAHERPDLACAILALRPCHRQVRNWEVAKFSLGDSPVTDLDERIKQIAQILVRTAFGIDVDWPTVALH
ncbi:hypothetical protein [Polaromonas sp. YR568]|uniref:hypothetical protein n=1 Tax=Polaromonas sp. YR568 TaxID=1855301 RepID=UPI00398BC09D